MSLFKTDDDFKKFNINEFFMFPDDIYTYYDEIARKKIYMYDSWVNDAEAN